MKKKTAKKKTPAPRGPKPGTGGRPKGPAKVPLTVLLLPETMEAIRELGRAGAVIDGWASDHMARLARLRGYR